MLVAAGATRGGDTFQRSRMVRQPAVNRSSRRFDSFRWSLRPLEETLQAKDVGSNPTCPTGADVLATPAPGATPRAAPTSGSSLTGKGIRLWNEQTNGFFTRANTYYDTTTHDTTRNTRHESPRSLGGTEHPSCTRARASTPVRLRTWAPGTLAREGPTRKSRNAGSTPARGAGASAPSASRRHARPRASRPAPVV